MFNAATKTSCSILAAAVMAACTGSAQRDEAAALTNSADSAIQAGNYTLATQLLDTLKSRCPSAVEAQRRGMHLRAIALEGETMAQINETENLSALYSVKIDSLKQYFTFVDNPQLVEGYWVIKQLAGSELFSRTGLEGRVSPDGVFYMISSTPAGVNHTSVTVTAGGVSAESATIAYDGERNYRSGGTEMITFTGAEADSIGALLSTKQNAKTTITFRGGKSRSASLSPADARSVALGWELSKAITEQRRLGSRRQLLDKQLMLARDQVARTSAD